MIDLRDIPSIDRLMQQEKAEELIREYGRDMTLRALRASLEFAREEIKHSGKAWSLDTTIDHAADWIMALITPSLCPVINASGIILHTNLGRAPLSAETITAMQTVSLGYSNLEYDLENGKRGKRSVHAEALLCQLTGAESALVVNNNAAAVLLVLSALAKGKRVIIANSQLIEIGGGFRVPDIMRQSGAKLAAVGTTNRVHLADYQSALEEPAALILCAHPSNFKVIGFTTEPELKDIASVAHQANLLLVYDLGSGALLDTSDFGLAHEPTVQEALADGADIVCFSGDKLFGGPQAGIIIGKADLLERIKRHPLARAVRADKLCLAGINATILHYLKGEALSRIPVWKMISMSPHLIQQRAENWRKILRTGFVQETKSMVGGGSLPEEHLPSYALVLQVKNPNQFHARLRKADHPVLARVEADRVLLDPRTVQEHEEESLLSGLRQALS